MQVKVEIDEKLLRDALAATGATSPDEVVQMGLRALLEHHACRRLIAMYGDGPKLGTSRRRRIRRAIRTLR